MSKINYSSCYSKILVEAISINSEQYGLSTYDPGALLDGILYEVKVMDGDDIDAIHFLYSISAVIAVSEIFGNSFTIKELDFFDPIKIGIQKYSSSDARAFVEPSSWRMFVMHCHEVGAAFQRHNLSCGWLLSESL